MTSHDSDPVEVQIPARPTGTFVQLRAPQHPHDDALLVFIAEIQGPGLAASVGVTTWGGDGLPEFVRGLEADFRGWDGERTWASLERDLELRATHRGGSIDLTWTLQFPQEPGTGDRFWTASLFLTIGAGEELKAMAADIEHFIETAMR